LVIVGGAAVFLALAMMATFALAAQFRRLIEPRVGNAHARVLRPVIVLVGGFTALLTTLSATPWTVSSSASPGQQTLSNLFAGTVLLLARPFTVGATVQLRSGALGRNIDGQVLEIGLDYPGVQSVDGPY
jgi:small-conductance mechanosensitive channel